MVNTQTPTDLYKNSKQYPKPLSHIFGSSRGLLNFDLKGSRFFTWLNLQFFRSDILAKSYISDLMVNTSFALALPILIYLFWTRGEEIKFL